MKIGLTLATPSGSLASYEIVTVSPTFATLGKTEHEVKVAGWGP